VNEHENSIARKVSAKLAGPPKTLTLEIRATEEDAEHVRLASFISQLDAFKEVLRQTERLMYGSEGHVYYRIAGLTQKSPATITIEAVETSARATGFGPAIFEGVMERLGTLSEANTDWLPSEFDLPALLAYQEFAPTNKRHISGLVVRSKDAEIMVDAEFNNALRTAIGPDQISRGDVVGALEMVNLHGNPRFEVYPAIGNHKVTCHFAAERKRDVIAALDHFVRVEGRLHYKRAFPHPHAIDLDTIEVLPDEDAITPFELLRGIAPSVSEKDVEDAKAALWW
jgi:hypothetical protein